MLFLLIHREYPLYSAPSFCSNPHGNRQSGGKCYFADNKNIDGNIYEGGKKYDMSIGEYDAFRFSVNAKSSLSDIAEALVKCVNHNKKSKFEARCSDNVVAFYAKREGKDYNGSEGGAKMLMESSLLYNRKISLLNAKAPKTPSREKDASISSK